MVNFNFPRNQFLPEQVPVIHKLVSITDAKKICEIGSWVGESTSYWANAIKDNDGKVYAVDWFKGNIGTGLDTIANTEDVYSIFISNISELGLRDVVEVFYMESLQAVKFFDDNSMDIVFIDASHDYDNISKDIRAWYPKVRKGGIICGHDCESREWDEQHIHTDYINGKHHGVVKAVMERFPNCNIDNYIWWQVKND